MMSFVTGISASYDPTAMEDILLGDEGLFKICRERGDKEGSLRLFVQTWYATIF
jgi:hypothetical protein